MIGINNPNRKRQVFILPILFVLWFVLGLALCTPSSPAPIHLPDGRTIHDASTMSVPKLAHLLNLSCDMAKGALKKAFSEKNTKESASSSDTYKKNLETAQDIFGIIQQKSRETGPGYINVHFPEGSSKLLKYSFEYQRFASFLNYIVGRNQGRRVNIVLLGTAPASSSETLDKAILLAQKRIETSTQIIDRYLANVPHVLFKADCVRNLPPSDGNHGQGMIASRDTYVAAVYAKRSGPSLDPSPSSQAATKPSSHRTSSSLVANPTSKADLCIKKRFKNSIGMEFVYVPPGTFVMGSPPQEYGHDLSEREHVVTFTKGFYLQTTEVTQGEWKTIMGENPSFFLNCGDDCPVENISWYDAQEFIKRLNEREGTLRYRLPTEAEWEYACRAGSKTAFANGGTITKETTCINKALGRMGWYYANSQKATHPVAQKAPNAWGLYDMHGNVWEWCQDWMAPYPFEVSTDPTGPPSGISRIRRGGSWQEYPVFCRSAYRGSSNPKYKGPSIGFRVAMSIKEPYQISPKPKETSAQPLKEKVPKSPKCILVRDIDFDFDSYKIKPEMKLILDKAAKTLKDKKGKILIEGFTCNIGSATYNMELSLRRAAAVATYLIRKGIPASRIITRGFGEARPKFPNKYEAGRRLNRRVEIHLVTDGS